MRLVKGSAAIDLKRGLGFLSLCMLMETEEHRLGGTRKQKHCALKANKIAKIY